jgi:hypothetical protein
VVDLENILSRIADAALRDKIRRQIEIQNETISNLESLSEVQSKRIKQLETELQFLKEQKSRNLPPISSETKLFESDGVYWSVDDSRGLKIFRAHCPQCQGPLNRIADFWECRACGFQDIGAIAKPTRIPDWAI